MAKKITNINFYNYKAFYSKTENAYTLNLDDKNLLIYGENGSGKSSIFDGLKDFFLSSIKEIEFVQNVFSIGSIPQEPFIEVQFSEDAQIYSFSTDEYKTNTKSFPFIRDVNKVKAFISYKDLLKTHFLTTPLLKINLFPLLFGDGGILSNISSSLLKTAKRSEYTFFDFWKEIDNSTISTEMPGTITISPEYNALIDLYETAVNKFLDDIKDLTNLYLEYFDKNLFISEIKIEINKTGLVSESEEIGFMKPRIIPKLKFYNNEIQYYPSFLNEARLTALALSIYLAAIESNPKNDYQILFFDDIFIGLDTSNRIPLLNLIKENLLQKYQIVITTYDKYWFELAKAQLDKNNWLTAEMYIKEDTANFQPVIIQPSLDYYELAKKYFDAKDYPACGNYQRKAFEKLISDFLPSNLTLEQNEDGTVNRITKLETLFDQFRKYVNQCGLDFSPFADFGLYKRVVLNPLSHDDIQSPYFKAELEKSFDILDSLQKIKKTEIVKAGESLFITKNDSQGIENKFSLKAKENFYVFKQGSLKIYSKIDFETISKWSNGVRVDFPSDITRLELVYKNICTFLNITPQTDFSNEFYTDQNNYLSNF